MVEEKLNQVIESLKSYETISRFVDLEKAKVKWLEKLLKNKEKVLERGVTYNLFNLILRKIKSNLLENDVDVEAILYNLDRYLEIMMDYDEEIIKNFSDKLLNINGKHLFSTLTELAIANHYKENKFKVDFFFKYNLKYKDGCIKQKDFDLFLNDGKNKMIVEVYTPTHIPDEDLVLSGNYDVDIADLRKHIYEKIESKLDLKISPEIIGISYPLLFAINTHYDAMFQTQINIPFKLKKLYTELGVMLTDIPKISGLMLIETNFTVKNSRLSLRKIIWNPKYAS